MARNGTGTYSLVAGNPVVTGTAISSTWANNTLSDIATALTQSLSQDGQTPVTANLPMGGFKLTGLAAGSTAGDSVRYEQFASPPAIGSTTPTTGAFTQITSTVATGTAPMVVASTTEVANLHAATATTSTNLSGGTVSATTVAASGLITSTVGNNLPIINAVSANTGYQTINMANTNGHLVVGLEGSTGGTFSSGTTAYDSIILGKAGIYFSATDGVSIGMRLSSTGLAVSGAVSGTTGTFSGAVSGTTITGTGTVTGADSAGNGLIGTTATGVGTYGTATTSGFGVLAASNTGIGVDCRSTTGAAIRILQTAVPEASLTNITDGCIIYYTGATGGAFTISPSFYKRVGGVWTGF